jgi:hypothetical protein
MWICLPAPALYYPATGFSNDFYIYHENPPSPEHYSGKLVIKFWNGYSIDRSIDSEDMFVSYDEKSSSHVTGINACLASYNVTGVTRAFNHPPEQLKAIHEDAELLSGQELPDMNTFFFLEVPEYTEALEMLWSLYSNPICEVVYMHPKPPPPPTPDLSRHQVYLHGAVSNGYDFFYAWTQPGGDGSQVRIIDIEYDWYEQHEDLQMSSADVLYGYESNLFGLGRDHGTASVGVYKSLHNGYGMKGAAYNADAKMISSLDGTAAWILHDAIYAAISNTSPGDIILLEQQGYAHNHYCPVEYYSLYYTPIAYAAALDRIVIEPAGNGNADLDDTGTWGNLFQRTYRDSGALIIGGGRAANRFRWSDSADPNNGSTYGSRVDIQGWADYTVATLAYGDLYGTVLSNQYTSTFAGTSSASALAAAAAAACESYSKDNYGMILPPTMLRRLIVSNGLQQPFGTGKVGPLPNLSNTFSQIIPEPGFIGILIATVLILCRKK